VETSGRRDEGKRFSIRAFLCPSSFDVVNSTI
jgi:hypothetical protein